MEAVYNIGGLYQTVLFMHQKPKPIVFRELCHKESNLQSTQQGKISLMLSELDFTTNILHAVEEGM